MSLPTRRTSILSKFLKSNSRKPLKPENADFNGDAAFVSDRSRLISTSTSNSTKKNIINAASSDNCSNTKQSISTMPEEEEEEEEEVCDGIDDNSVDMHYINKLMEEGDLPQDEDFGNRTIRRPRRARRLTSRMQEYGNNHEQVNNNHNSGGLLNELYLAMIEVDRKSSLRSKSVSPKNNSSSSNGYHTPPKRNSLSDVHTLYAVVDNTVLKVSLVLSEVQVTDPSCLEVSSDDLQKTSSKKRTRTPINTDTRHRKTPKRSHKGSTRTTTAAAVTTTTDDTDINDDDDDEIISVDSNFIQENLEAHVMDIVVNSMLQQQPSSSAVSCDPLRKRHPDYVYGAWCSQLLHCLLSSGRKMARYEWFYSNIDRPWFNQNNFVMKVLKLGVPLNRKLSRKEWRVVRRLIQQKRRGRPRRFSKRFIYSEKVKLDKFRMMVRQLWQRHRHDENYLDSVKPWSLEIPSKPRIGSTVTAYNQKAQLVHRGIVLSHETTKCHVLRIQFERKELGVEVVADTDVASHGIPSVLLPASNFCNVFDNRTFNDWADLRNSEYLLPYGTEYGPMSDNYFFDRDEKLEKLDYFMDNNDHDKNDNKINEVSIEAVINQLHSEDESGGLKPQRRQTTITSKAMKQESSKDAVSRAEILDLTIERIILQRLLDTLSDLRDRKASILNAIQSCHSSHIPSTSQAYIWLHANLKTTNHSIRHALALLYEMHSQIYACSSSDRYNYQHNGKKCQISSSLPDDHQLKNSYCYKSGEGQKWLDSCKKTADIVSEKIVHQLSRDKCYGSNGSIETGAAGKKVISPDDTESNGAEMETMRTIASTLLLCNQLYSNEKPIEDEQIRNSNVLVLQMLEKSLMDELKSNFFSRGIDENDTILSRALNELSCSMKDLCSSLNYS